MESEFNPDFYNGSRELFYSQTFNFCLTFKSYLIFFMSQQKEHRNRSLRIAAS